MMNAITKPSFGMASSDRKLLYGFAVRSSEIRSLKVADVDTQRHIISVRSSDTKDAESAQQHYGPDLAQSMARYFSRRPSHEPKIFLCNSTNMVRMLQAQKAVTRLPRFSTYMGRFAFATGRASKDKSGYHETSNDHAERS